MKQMIMLLLVLGTAATVKAQDLNNRRGHVLDRKQFEHLKQVVNAEAFPDNKKIAFKAALQHDLISVDQLSDFLKQFAFDDEKFNWVTLAYPYVADVQHYDRLRASFSFISTQNKFDQYLLNMANAPQPGMRDAKVLHRNEFAAMQAAILKEPFADGKKNIFRAAMQGRYLTVAQVSELLKQFTFDDDKLAWAFLTYNYTADVQNFYQVRDLFTFDMNKQKLDGFLADASK